jgi:hypothetical protein
MTYIAADDRHSKIPYRRCGRSGVLLPEISLGLWQNFGDGNRESSGANWLALAIRSMSTASRHPASG